MESANTLIPYANALSVHISGFADKKAVFADTFPLIGMAGLL
jgi:hypothetical protein